MPSTPGNLWMAACEAWLKERIWPSVGRQRQPEMNDFTGTWDLGIEATIEPWSKVWWKLDQAERDARNRGLDLYCVWKKRNRVKGDRGAVDPGRGAVIMRAREFFPMVMRLEELERCELDAEREFKRGFRLGLEAQREAV